MSVIELGFWNQDKIVCCQKNTFAQRKKQFIAPLVSFFLSIVFVDLSIDIDLLRLGFFSPWRFYKRSQVITKAFLPSVVSYRHTIEKLKHFILLESIAVVAVWILNRCFLNTAHTHFLISSIVVVSNSFYSTLNAIFFIIFGFHSTWVRFPLGLGYFINRCGSHKMPMCLSKPLVFILHALTVVHNKRAFMRNGVFRIHFF